MSGVRWPVEWLHAFLLVLKMHFYRSRYIALFWQLAFV